MVGNSLVDFSVVSHPNKGYTITFSFPHNDDEIGFNVHVPSVEDIPNKLGDMYKMYRDVIIGKPT